MQLLLRNFIINFSVLTDTHTHIQSRQTTEIEYKEEEENKCITVCLQKCVFLLVNMYVRSFSNMYMCMCEYCYLRIVLDLCMCVCVFVLI